MFCDFIKRVDLYGKEPEFYFKGKYNKTSWIGRILTLLYVIIYIAFLIYKLNRMIKRTDVTFYDTTAYTGEIPSIQLNKEIFYGAFAFTIPGTDVAYWDPRIYTIDAQFVSQVKTNGVWSYSYKNVTFKRCELSDFGSNYQSILANKDLSGFLCPTTVDFLLEGYTTLERYSYISMKFKVCKNTTENNNHCYPLDYIQQFLYATSIDSKIEDIDLTPQDHDHPIQYLERDIPGPTYQELHQMIYVYMQLVIIETDDNIIGFEALSKTNTEKHLKYETSWIISSPNIQGNYIQNPDYGLNDITIQLSPTVLTQKRTYVQLIDVLGDVGGLMEIVNMIFSIICSLITNILYEKSLVNNLFNFDLDKKIIVLKNRKMRNIKFELDKEDIIIPEPKDPTKNENQNINNEENTNKEEKKEENILEKNNENNGYLSIKRNKRKAHSKKDPSSSKTQVDIYQRKNKSSKRNLYDIKDRDDYIKKMNEFLDEEDEDERTYKKKNKETNDENKKNKNLIKKIQVNKFYIHCGFCCVRSISNLNNTLIDEGMKLIVEQLDILNIFRKNLAESKREKQLKEKGIILEMSDECKINLVEQSKKLNEKASIDSE